MRGKSKLRQKTEVEVASYTKCMLDFYHRGTENTEKGRKNLREFCVSVVNLGHWCS